MPSGCGTPRGEPYQCKLCALLLCGGWINCGVVAAGHYLRWKAGLPCRTSSQIWDSWNLARDPVEGWIFDPDKHSLLDGPSSAVCLPTHNGETLHIDAMSWSVGMFIYRGGYPEMLLKPVPKGTSQLTKVPLFTVCLGTLEPIAYLTFIGDIIFVLQGH